MKLTETVIELMFQLSNIEGIKHFEEDTSLLRNSLLKLFNSTDNPEAHEIIIDIMSEAGYPWFGTIAQQEKASVLCSASEMNLGPRVMSDADFMDLLPANGRLH